MNSYSNLSGHSLFKLEPLSKHVLRVALLAIVGLSALFAMPSQSTSTQVGQVEAQVRSFGPQVAVSLTPTSEFQRVQQPVAGYRALVPVVTPGAPAGLKPAEQMAWQAMARRTMQAESARSGLTPIFPEHFSEGTEMRGLGMTMTLKPLGSNAATAQIEQGKLVYHGAYPATDSLQVITAGRSEEFLLLHDASAPTRFEYELTGVSGVKDISLQANTIHFKNAKGQELQIEQPWLIETGGKKVADKVHWELTSAKTGHDWPTLALVVNDAKSLRYPVVIDPTWTASQTELATPRIDHTATLLTNGMVLVAGGDYNGAGLNSAELFDPFTGQWTATGSLNDRHYKHTATLLPNGKVLVVGGYDDNLGAITASSELYDPLTGIWTRTGSLNCARDDATATLLPCGKVLVVGGVGPSGFLASSELYDPATCSWTKTNGTLNFGRFEATATLLPNGQVLVAGGPGSAATSSELYNPATGLWTSTTGSLNTPRYGHTATLLANGKVLIAGGADAVAGSPLTSSELYDPVAQTWTATTGSLNTARYKHSATLLTNGQVLVAGGGTDSSGDVTGTTELYDPVADSWSTSTSLVDNAEYHTATLLANGEILVAGGYNGAFVTAHSALYDLAAGAWTVPSAAPSSDHNLGAATELSNGQVLVTGGQDDSGNGIATADLYDPVARTWTPTGSLHCARYSHTATLLANGQVLVAGGVHDVNDDTVARTEVYDPSTGQWTVVGSLNVPRFYHTANLLTNGQVLVAGGRDTGFNPQGRGELYDPVAKTWTFTTGSQSAPRVNQTATLLDNGKVLMTGGTNPMTGATSAIAEFYDPSTEIWTATGSLATARYNHTASLLPDGQVLVTSGYDSNFIPTGSAELYDPVAGTWTSTGSLNAARGVPAATVLANGEVMVSGGLDPTGVPLTSVELYNPATGHWTLTGSLTNLRAFQTTTLLPNGQVLLRGAASGYVGVPEIFDPGLGFTTATQPVVNALTNNQLSIGGTLTLTGTGFTGISEASGGNTQSSASNVPMVQLQSLVNEQIVDLDVDPTHHFSATSVVTGPFSGMPPGYAYLTVFVNGTPSQAQIVSITKAAQTIGTFSTIPGHFYGDVPFQVTPPTASSGLPVTLSVQAGSPATIDSNNIVTLTGLGTVTLLADQAGDGTYAAAPEVSTSFASGVGTQVITFPPVTGAIVGHNVALNASASSGQTIIYRILPTAGYVGNGSIAGNTITFTAAGKLRLEASAPAVGSYQAVHKVIEITVAEGSQNFAWDMLGTVTVGHTFSFRTTTIADLPITYSIVPTAGFTGTATVSRNVVTFTGAGMVRIAADQAGNPNYAPVHMTQDVLITKASQIIPADPLGTVTPGQTTVLPATTDAGLPITYSIIPTAGYTGTASISSNTITFTGAGKIKIAADQAGNATYNAATEVRQNITVTPGTQTFSWGTLIGVSVGQAFTFPSATNQGLFVTYSVVPVPGFTGTATISGDKVTFTGAGKIRIAADQAGSATYAPAHATQDITISKDNQGIVFPTLGPVMAGQTVILRPFALRGNLPINYSVIPTAGYTGTATIVGNSITFTSAGKIKLAADQPGNAQYAPALQVRQNVTVNIGAQAITFPKITGAGMGQTITLPATATSGLPITYSIIPTSGYTGTATISGNSITFTGTGNIKLAADQAGNSSFTAAPQTRQVVAIGLASQTITFPTVTGAAVGQTITLPASSTSGLPITYNIIPTSGYTGTATISGDSITYTGAGKIKLAADQSGDGSFAPATEVRQNVTISP